MIEKIDKIINPIRKKTYGGRTYNVYIHIEFENKELSITGVEGPLPSGNCLGSCGQIDMTLEEDAPLEWEFNTEWNLTKMDMLLEIWKQWHLNGMNAGTPKQTMTIDKFRKENNITGWGYTQEVKHLKSIGLYNDNGYKYGTSWLSVDIPQNILEWLNSLPDSIKKPAWI